MTQCEGGIQFRKVIRAAAGLLLALAAVAIWAGVSLAGDQTEQAGLVIYYGEETIEYHLFDLTSENTTGMELLEATGLDLEVQPFSGLGEAVCSINGHGCPGRDCFCESYSSPVYFWRYYVREDGQWLPQQRGSSQREVQAGEIHAFAWADGDPEFPDITFDQLKNLASEEPIWPTPVPDSDIILTPETAPEAEPSPVATPTVPVPEQSPEVATDNEDESIDTTTFLQFLALFGFVAGIVIWAGVRRYRGGPES